MKANIWQSMPNLNIARRNASGQTIGDSLFVFGGIGGSTTIERLNLKLNMQRTGGDKFELIEVKLPYPASDIGLLPCLSAQEVLLVGGFSPEGHSLKRILKFSARPAAAQNSQDQVDCLIEELDSESFRADFFNTNSLVSVPESSSSNPATEQVILFGAQYKHTFTGSTFTSSQQQLI